jgi:hypothetical protein
MNLPQPDSGPDSNINSPYCIEIKWSYSISIARYL